MIYAKQFLLGGVALAAALSTANSHAKSQSQSEALAPGYQLVRGASQQAASQPAHELRLNIHIPTDAELAAAGIATDDDASQDALNSSDKAAKTAAAAPSSDAPQPVTKARPKADTQPSKDLANKDQDKKNQTLASDVRQKDPKSPKADDSKSQNTTTTASKDQDSKTGSAGTDDATFVQKGVSSWYGKDFAGRKTASGEIFDPQELTAAHKDLPLGSVIRVSYPATGKSVVVRVTDRGPYHGNRILDLSYAAAKKIGMVKAGKGKVKIELISKKGGKAKAKKAKTTF